MKFHVRKDENGKWVEENGQVIPHGAAIVYHYGAKAAPQGRLVTSIRSAHPHVSKNAAIHVDQVKDFNKRCARGTHYDPRNGNLVSNSAGAREREARRRDMSFS
jgi:hypothetical protein